MNLDELALKIAQQMAWVVQPEMSQIKYFAHRLVAELAKQEPRREMNTTQLARQAIRAWPRHELATRKQVRALRIGYIRARRMLGDRYLLAVPVQRKDAV